MMDWGEFSWMLNRKSRFGGAVIGTPVKLGLSPRKFVCVPTEEAASSVQCIDSERDETSLSSDRYWMRSDVNFNSAKTTSQLKINDGGLMPFSSTNINSLSARKKYVPGSLPDIFKPRAERVKVSHRSYIHQKENLVVSEINYLPHGTDGNLSRTKENLKFSHKREGGPLRRLLMSRRNESQQCRPIHLEGRGESSVECRRALHFENAAIREAQDEEDVTVPLAMMDFTSVISRDSSFNDPVHHQPDPPRSQREVDFTGRPSRSRTGTKIGDFTNCQEEIEDQFCQAENVLLKNESLKRSCVSRIPSPKIVTRSLSTLKERNNIPNTRNNRRRSALPASKLTPRYKIYKDLRSKSTSKFGVKVPKNDSTTKDPSKRPKSRKSITTAQNIPEIDVMNVGNSAKQPEQCNISTQTISQQKSDAATEIDFEYFCGNGLTSDLVKKVEYVNSEIDEIRRKADQIKEQTLARRKRMKETRVLESFSTSVSPLKRIRAMIQENSCSQSTGSPSTSYAHSSPGTKIVSESKEEPAACRRNSVCLDECDMDITNPHEAYADKSYMDHSMFNTTGDLNQSKWKHLKLNSRVFHTPSSHNKRTGNQPISSPEEESFCGKSSDELSPFTEMAGDCERPSLAPMTPHSHRQVSLIKLSLRKQLDQLYQ